MRKIGLPPQTAKTGALFGNLDENAVKVERAFDVSVINRGESLVIQGAERAEGQAAAVFEKLLSYVERGETISEQTVNYIIASLEDDGFDEIDKLPDDVVCLTAAGRHVKPKTIGQKRYVENIRKNTVVFGIGPAGTGKTYLAMALAISAFKKGEASRIVLTRPALEAGEKLGFLPGDLQQKVDPYLRPLFDALNEIMGNEAFLRNMEKGLIEVAPLAYMRGRTLDNSFIVLDEAQNTTKEQMKMFLTRIGFGSKAVVTGDLTQVDLPAGKTSGLAEAVSILKNIEGIGISALTAKDVVRHQLVQKIINAYEKAAQTDAAKPTNRKYKISRF